MNCLTIMGYLEKDAVYVSDRSTFLECTVIVQKKGFGTYANKVFRDKIKVVFYSREAQALATELVQGTWVEATGEASAEAWVGTDTKPHGRVKIMAKSLSACLFDQAPQN